MTATCTNCSTQFIGVDQNEDGSPYIESQQCAHPGCEVFLCGAACQELSFQCSSCGLRFCEPHGLHFGYERLCIACVAEALAIEPDCECHQTDVDVFDPRGCEYHDERSPWNVRRRAITSVQQYEIAVKEIA